MADPERHFDLIHLRRWAAPGAFFAVPAIAGILLSASPLNPRQADIDARLAADGPRERVRTLRWIGELPWPPAWQLAVPSLADMDEDARRAAARAIGAHASTHAIPTLAARLDVEPDERVRRDLIDAISFAASPESFAALMDYAARADEEDAIRASNHAQAVYWTLSPERSAASIGGPVHNPMDPILDDCARAIGLPVSPEEFEWFPPAP